MIDPIRTLAEAPTLLVALDFDGTLAPLVDVPLDSRMLPQAREAIAALSSLPDTHVALVSGRTLLDLEIVSEHAAESPVLLSGSHGAQFRLPERWGSRATHEASPRVKELIESMRELLAPLENVWVEEKPFGFVVHTRLADRATTERASAQVNGFASEHLDGWRRRGGHDIVEFSERAEGKDTAIRVLRDLVGATAVLFAGDDETDEDAIAALDPGDVGVRVGAGESAAQVRLPDAEAMAAFLTELARARADVEHPAH